MTAWRAGVAPRRSATDYVGVSTRGGDSTFTLTTSGVGASTIFDDGSIQVMFTPFSGTGSLPSILGCIIILPPLAEPTKEGFDPEI